MKRRKCLISLHPADNLLTIRLLDENGKYIIPEIREGKGTVSPAILPSLTVNLDTVFGSPPQPGTT